MTDDSPYYSQENQREQLPVSWQDMIYYPLKWLAALPRAIYKVIWAIFWRYLKT